MRTDSTETLQQEGAGEEWTKMPGESYVASHSQGEGCALPSRSVRAVASAGERGKEEGETALPFAPTATNSSNRVDRCHQEVLLFGRELVEEVLIVQVKGAEEEHDLENLWDGYRQTREGQKMPLEAGTKLVDPLLVTLPVIEERQQGGEGVGNGGGPEVVLEDLEHLETLVLESRTSVLKEKPGRAALQGRTELTLPELAGKHIRRIRDEG